MLSQRIALFSQNYNLASEDNIGKKKQELIKTVRLFKTSHNALLNGDTNQEITNSAGIIARDIYFEAPYMLDDGVNEFFRHVEALLAGKTPEERKKSVTTIVGMSSGPLLEKLDMVVKRIETYDIKQNKELKKLETIFYICALVLLILEGRFIFWPSYLAIKLSLKEKQELEETKTSLKEANTELEEFAYRTSHDLRSPLISSIGLLGFIAEFIKQGEQDKALKGIESTRSSLQKLEDLVEDILTLTKTKNIETPYEEIDVYEIVANAIDKLSHMDGSNDIKIIHEIRHSKQIHTQKDRFILIIENLISNAYKYRNPEEKSSFIKISTYEKNDEFIIEIQDNGLGIPDDQHHKMFKMFSRFHPRISFGSGLGLYMIKKSADLINAVISYEKPENGSIFRLVLPSTPSAQQETV